MESGPSLSLSSSQLLATAVSCGVGLVGAIIRMEGPGSEFRVGLGVRDVGLGGTMTIPRSDLSSLGSRLRVGVERPRCDCQQVIVMMFGYNNKRTYWWDLVIFTLILKGPLLSESSCKFIIRKVCFRVGKHSATSFQFRIAH